MSFDFEWTCPIINSEINEIESAIKSTIDELLNDACPLLSNETHDQLVKQYSTQLYDALESHIEGVRSTNEKMRSAANEQIDDLDNDKLKDDKRKLEDKVDDLENWNRRLENKVEELEKELNTIQQQQY